MSVLESMMAGDPALREYGEKLKEYYDNLQSSMRDRFALYARLESHGIDTDLFHNFSNDQIASLLDDIDALVGRLKPTQEDES